MGLALGRLGRAEPTAKQTEMELSKPASAIDTVNFVHHTNNADSI